MRIGYPSFRISAVLFRFYEEHQFQFSGIILSVEPSPSDADDKLRIKEF
jgi:hypothetical protein